MNVQALSVIQWIGVIGSAVAAVAAGRFVMHYRRARWRRSETGRLVMLMAGTLTALFLLTVGISLGIASNGLVANTLRGVRTVLCFVFAVLMTWQDRIRARESRPAIPDDDAPARDEDGGR